MNAHQTAIALAALNHIASWPEGQFVDSTFDSPADAKTARQALAAIDDAARPGVVCLITGCALLNPATNRAVWGDLHCIDNVAVFNACLNPRHESAWVEIGPMLDATPSCTLGEGQEFFERRAVIVFDLSQTTLNRAAQQRMVPRG